MKKIIIFLNGLFLLQLASSAQEVDIKRIKQDIEYLSSDKLEGRFPGTKSEKKSAAYLVKQFEKLKLQPKGSMYYFQEFPFKYNRNPHDTGEQNAVRGTAKNIVAYLDNQAEYTIVIGAHYDHLGLGEAGNALDVNHDVHNGADDNASGTAGVLELARYYSNNKLREPVNFLFICFSAEEMGLLGSKYFTNNPSIPLEKVFCMLNMDMIGRFNDSTQKIIVAGAGTSPGFIPTLQSVCNAEIGFKADSAGMGPSDHASFYLKNIPVLHFFTGTHSDYHKASDDAEKINYAGEKKVLEFMIRFIDKISQEAKPAFTPTRNPQSGGASFKVTLGIIPDYAFDGEGVRVDGVSEGKPAQKAGILAGDVIIAMNDIPVKDMATYMKCLSLFKKGEQVQVKLKRAQQELVLPATF